MSTAHLIRWSGLITVSAGLLYALGALLHPVGESLAAVNSSNWVIAHLVYWLSVILLHIGLLGLYARQVEATGWLGLVGFVLAFIGTAVVGSIQLYVSTVLPIITTEAQAIFDQAAEPPAFVVAALVVGFALGWMLLGIATMRARVFPRWSGLLLVIGVSLFVISEAAPFGARLAHMLVTIGDMLFALGLVWIGTVLWRMREPAKQAKSPTSVSVV